MRLLSRLSATIGLFLVCEMALAQGTTAALAGTATSKGNPLPGVSVAVMSQSLPGTRIKARGGSRLRCYSDPVRQVVLYPGEDGLWVVECPSLPGCVSQGPTRDEAIENIREAIRAYVAALESDGLPVPEERFETRLVEV